ncbi:MAG: MBL fold metallo-hydrolase RNA specificity domain-containing protein, partial [Methanobacteriaceae archaeon]|nr:MBL fold metallo-hydrolase RNA specificity domain-containing protein [Methanobacteriaceae archaeon]
WLDHFNLEMFQMHASGHASGPEILEMIEEIGPKKVYPVHTNQKEKFLELKKSNIDVVYPKLS